MVTRSISLNLARLQVLMTMLPDTTSLFFLWLLLLLREHALVVKLDEAVRSTDILPYRPVGSVLTLKL